MTGQAERRPQKADPNFFTEFEKNKSMVTPLFSVTQNEKELKVILRVPFIKLSTIDHYISQNEFKFYGKPYFLRLNFSHYLKEDGNETGKYNVDSGELTYVLPKLNEGEVFENLNMLTFLLAPSKPNLNDAKLKTSMSKIQVVGSEEYSDPESENEEEEGYNQEEDHVQWEKELEEEITTKFEKLEIKSNDSNNNIKIGTDIIKYGFNNLYSNVFASLTLQSQEIVLLPYPDSTPSEQRYKLRRKHEIEQFDPEYYQLDFLNDETVRQSFTFVPPWISHKHDILSSIESSSESESESESSDESSDESDSAESKTNSQQKKIQFLNDHPIQWTEKQKDSLLSLPKKHYLISTPYARKLVYFGLIDILYCYCYSYRTALGDIFATPELDWTLRTLSPSFAFLDSNFNLYSGSKPFTLKKLRIHLMRRSLIYPVIRHWGIAKRCWEDVKVILFCGKDRILQSLLEVKAILEKSEGYWILNKIFVDDYAVWIQSVKEEEVQALVETMEAMKDVKKGDLNMGNPEWELEKLESQALDKLMKDEESH